MRGGRLAIPALQRTDHPISDDFDTTSVQEHVHHGDTFLGSRLLSRLIIDAMAELPGRTGTLVAQWHSGIGHPYGPAPWP